jgi:predicted 2-oxoglutarate/Fe(II)-dependent dioxygenase YbiX
MVIDRTSTSDDIKLVEDDRRVSDRVKLGPHQQKINQIVHKAFVDLARKYYDAEIDWFETPQMLRYSPGGFYVAHADSENMNPQTRTWTKAIDRDLSLLIYLNNDYKGGELRFDKFNFRLRPRAGMAVMFPSDNRYMHEAETITEGQRYAIVSWAAVSGVRKVGKQPPKAAMFVNYKNDTADESATNTAASK